MLAALQNLLCPPPKWRPHAVLAESCFTKEELDAIRREHTLHVLSKYVQTIDDAHFLEWAGLQHAAPALTHGLCAAVRRLSGPDAAGAITLEGILVSKARCEKMDSVTAQDFAFDVLDAQEAGQVTRSHLEAVVLGCLELSAPSSSSSSSSAAHSATASAIAAGMCSYSGPGSQVLTRDGYSKLCKVSPALNSTLLTLLSNIGKSAAGNGQGQASPAAASPARPAGPSNAGGGARHRTAQQRSDAAGPGPGSAAAAAAAAAAQGPGRVLLPQLGWGSVSPDEGLLQPGWVWLLAPGLAPAQRLDWRLLFSSRKHGASFNILLGRLGEASPTLLLIRDKGGALFGGIAHKPWSKQGDFYGDHASAIFRLLPQVQVFPASGINSNIQWCGVGFSQLPNGIGFGGQTSHFAVWLHASMDHGMSRQTATFASPSLSSEEVFQVDVVEVWQLQPPEEDEPGTGSKARSVLDKAKEDRHILELAGVATNYRAALGDEPIEE